MAWSKPDGLQAGAAPGHLLELQAGAGRADLLTRSTSCCSCARSAAHLVDVQLGQDPVFVFVSLFVFSTWWRSPAPWLHLVGQLLEVRPGLQLLHLVDVYLQAIARRSLDASEGPP